MRGQAPTASDDEAQQAGQRAALGDVLGTNGQHPASGEQHPAGDLVGHSVVAGALGVGQRDRTNVVNGAGDAGVDVDQQRVDRTERGQAGQVGRRLQCALVR